MRYLPHPQNCTTMGVMPLSGTLRGPLRLQPPKPWRRTAALRSLRSYAHHLMSPDLQLLYDLCLVRLPDEKEPRPDPALADGSTELGHCLLRILLHGTGQ